MLVTVILVTSQLFYKVALKIFEDHSICNKPNIVVSIAFESDYVMNG